MKPVLTVSVIVMMMLAVSAQATVLFDEPFNELNLARLGGQGNWTMDNGVETWVVEGVEGLDGKAVQSYYSWDRFHGDFDTAGTADTVTVDFQLKVDSAAPTDMWRQISLRGDSTAAVTIYYKKLSTGYIQWLYQDGTSANPTGTTVHTAVDTVTTVSLAIDFDTKTYDFAVDSGSGATTVVEGAAWYSTGVSSIDNIYFSGATESGYTYIDNILVEQVPEPASLGVIVLGGGMLAGFCRRRRSL